MAASFLDATLITLDGERRTVTADDMHYAYRHSALKDGLLAGVLTTVRVRLSPGDPVSLRAAAKEYHDWRKVAQPQAASAGSMFQNPPGDAAGRLIERAGMKGVRVGDAQVSPVHANFIVNLGKATATDILTLGNECRTRVREQFGVSLQYEVQRIGRWTVGEKGQADG
jgi:UDP-N-acetylmuramate dehydrogenase